jgi:hypothetical protein
MVNNKCLDLASFSSKGLFLYKIMDQGLYNYLVCGGKSARVKEYDLKIPAHGQLYGTFAFTFALFP